MLHLVVVVSLLAVEAACQFPPPIAVAHRGASGVRPENTLESFAEGTAQGALVNELDLMITADNKVIVMHDTSVDRTTNGTGLVKEKKLDELLTLDAGSWFAPEFSYVRVPTIEQVFQQFLALPDWPSRRLLLDVKYDSRQILDYLYGLDLPDQLLARLMMGTWTMPETEYTTQLWGNRTHNCIIMSSIPPGLESRPDVTILNLNKQAVTDGGASLVAQMRGLGKEVYGWTSASVDQTISDTARATQDGWNGVVGDYPEYVLDKQPWRHYRQ